MKVLFLTKRTDHQLNNNPLIQVTNSLKEASEYIRMRRCVMTDDDLYHPGWFILAHDIETQTEWPLREGLLLSSFCQDREHVLVIDNTSVDNTEVFTEQFLKRCLFIAHNADFEARWGVATGFLPMRYACTMVNDKRLLSGQQGFRFDIISTITRRLGWEQIPEWMDKDIRSQFATCKHFTDEQVLYNAADTIRLKPIYYEQLKAAAKYRMEFLLGTINSRIIIPIARAEVTGIKHDSKKWNEIARGRARKAEEICQELTKIVIEEYRVDLEKVNPALKVERERKEKREQKLLERKARLEATITNLEQRQKQHLKSYAVSLIQLQKVTEDLGIISSGKDIGTESLLNTPNTLLMPLTQIQSSTNTMQGLDLTESGLINWGSQKQVIAVLQQIGCPIPQTKDKKTRQLKDGVGKEARANWFVNNEGSPYEGFMKKYDSFKKLIHNVNSFGEEWVKQYTNPHTGRIHTMLDQAGADTGRFSSGSRGNTKAKKYPNLQQIPKPPEYRECFIADPGRSIITLDYKNCEGVIMIAQSGDLDMKKITSLKDQHSYLGTKCWRNVYKHRYQQTGDPKWGFLAENYEMNQDTPEKKKERDIFKNSGGLFPVAYGVYASKVAAAAKTTVTEGQIFIDTIKDEIPLVISYLDSVSKGALAKGYAFHNNRSGSRRWFQPILDHKHYGWKLDREAEVEIGSAARNTVIQGTNSDIIKEAIAWLDLWAKLFKQDVRFLLTVHDELVIDCPEGKEDFYLEKISNIMRRVAQNYLIPEINMDVDAHHAKHWKK